MLALKAEVRKCEERLAKLNDMRNKLATKLADQALYEPARKGELETWNRKYAEVMDGLDRAEAMWLAAQGKLEMAEAERCRCPGPTANPAANGRPSWQTAATQWT